LPKFSKGSSAVRVSVVPAVRLFPPELSASSAYGEKRVRRLVKGESTTRSDLTDQLLIARMQQRAVELLRAEAEVWVIVDGSDLRKPQAQDMEALMKVRALRGQGLVPGYRTINAIGVARGKRGLLYHHLFSSKAADFVSEPGEVQRALQSVGGVLAASRAAVTYLLDRGFDDVAVWGTIWAQGHHLVCRVAHLDRLITQFKGDREPETVALATAAGQMRELACAEAELDVRKRDQRRAKRQKVTAHISACPVRVSYQAGQRSEQPGPRQQKDVWLVRVELEDTTQAPWWLLTDWPVDDAASALRVFQMYCQRWAVEDGFKFIKQCVGWEDVQMLSLAAVRLLVALGWIAAGFLYELGVTWDWAEVQLLARLGGWEKHKNRRPGKFVITRGLRRLLDVMSVEAILHDHIAAHGQLPPRIAALLGRT